MTDLTSVKGSLDGVSEPDKKGARDLVGETKSLATQAADRVQQASDQMRRRVSDGAEVARDWAADQSDVLRDTVQTKPFIAIGVSASSAFALGLVLGVLLARR